MPESLAATKASEYDAVVRSLFEQLQTRLRDGKADREQLADLLSEIRDDAGLQDERAAVLRLARPLLTDDFYSLDEVEALTRVIELFPGVLEEEEIANARKNFLAFCSEEVLNMHGERDVDSLRDTADRLHIAGSSLGLDVSSRVADLWSSADEIEEERERERELERDEEPPPRWTPVEAAPNDDAVIDAMFTSLRDELRANAE